jgi:hypothetical protein
VKLTLVSGALSASNGLLTTVLDTSGPDPVVTATTGTILIPRKGLAALALAFTLDETPNGLTGSLTDTGTGQSAAVTGYRNPWHATAHKAAAYAGYYTFGLEIPAGSAGEQSIPQGDGFGGFTVKDNGTLTLAGQAADGQSFSVASFVSDGGAIAVFAPFTAAAPGSLLGQPVIAGNELTGELSWSKTAAGAKVKTQSYRDGFGPVALTVIGGRYAAPGPGQVVMGLPNVTNNARLVFAEGGLLPGDCAPLVFSIRNTGTKTAQTITLPAVNPNKMSFTLGASPLGMFSGKFTVNNAVKALVRTPGYQGMLVRNGDAMQSMGYFLLPMLPQPGQTLTTAPQLSGQAILAPAAP